MTAATIHPKTSTCTECGAAIEYQSGGPFCGPAYWYDPSNLDEDNDGSKCDATGAEHLPAPEDPDCQSCGDRVGGCSRCTDSYGDTR